MASDTKDREEKRDVRQFEKALRHPVRTRLRAELDSGSSLDELAATFEQPLRWITYHHRVLDAVGGLPTR